MQVIGYGSPTVDVSAVPIFGGALHWTEATVRRTARRAVALAALIDRAGSTLDDIAELRRAAQIIAGSLSQLGDSAAGINRNAGAIADEIAGLSTAAQGIDILVNNAGIGTIGAVATATVEKEIAQVRVNVEAVIDLTTRAVAQMVPPAVERSSMSGRRRASSRSPDRRVTPRRRPSSSATPRRCVPSSPAPGSPPRR